MNIEEIVLKGGTIEFPYAIKTTGFISIFRIIGLDNIILVQDPTNGTTDFDPTNIKDAVKMFTDNVFSSNNLMYKHSKVYHNMPKIND